MLAGYVPPGPNDASLEGDGEQDVDRNTTAPIYFFCIATNRAIDDNINQDRDRSGNEVLAVDG